MTTTAEANALDSEIRQLIHALPSDENKIADLFRSEGIRGRRYAPSTCPVANYVRQHIPRAQDVNVVGHAVTARHEPHGWRAYVWYPQAVADFISAFDAQSYPDLEIRA